MDFHLQQLLNPSQLSVGTLGARHYKVRWGCGVQLKAKSDFDLVHHLDEQWMKPIALV